MLTFHTLPEYWNLLKRTCSQWLEDKAPRLGAALAFYSVLSIGPLLLITISIAGAVFGEEAARGELMAQIKQLVGTQGAEGVQLVLANSRQPDANILASIIGMATLLLSASGVFGELQDALNTIWHVKAPEGKGIVLFFKARFLSFSMVLGIGFLLMVSLVITAVLTGLSGYITSRLPLLTPFLFIFDFLITLSVISILFALIFRILPDTDVEWSDVWIGAIVTGLLFTFGKFLIGLYLGHSAIASTYGAAGSVVILIIWVYYSAQILYFGAELTRAYAETLGSKSHVKDLQVII